MEQERAKGPEDPCRFSVGKTAVRVTYGGEGTLAQALTAYFTAQKRQPGGTAYGQTQD